MSTIHSHIFLFVNFLFIAEELKLVFTHISLADKGNWECEDTTGAKAKKDFDLRVLGKYCLNTDNSQLIDRITKRLNNWNEIKLKRYTYQG